MIQNKNNACTFSFCSTASKVSYSKNHIQIRDGKNDGVFFCTALINHFLQSISKAFSISIPRFIIENNYAFLFTDDPYYCGLRARIPNFVKSRKKKLEEKAKKDAQSSPAQAQLQAHPGQQRILPAPTLNSMSGVQGGVTSTNPLWWHSRLYSDLGPLGSMISILIHYFTLAVKSYA